MSQESILFFIAEGRYLFCVCGSGLGILFCCLFLFPCLFGFVCLYTYGVRGGMHATDLGDRGRGKKMFCWAGSIE